MYGKLFLVYCLLGILMVFSTFKSTTSSPMHHESRFAVEAGLFPNPYHKVDSLINPFLSHLSALRIGREQKKRFGSLEDYDSSSSEEGVFGGGERRFGHYVKRILGHPVQESEENDSD